MIFKIKIAERVIEIHSLYKEIYRLCKDYISEDGVPDISVKITEDDILLEREKSLKEQSLEGITPIRFPDDYLETLAVYRKICNSLIAYDTFLMHGSVVAVGNKAYMFTAASGTGKTTHIKLWLKNIEGSFVVNGDKPLLRVADKLYACGTPWCGKERMHTNTVVPLKAIVILERGEKNTITEISGKEALPMLIQQTHHSGDKIEILKILELLKKTIANTKLYRLSCNMDDEAALKAYQEIE